MCEKYRCTYFLDRILADISCDVHFVGLSMPKKTSYGLALHRRIPLRLEDVDTSSNAQIVQTEDKLSYDFCVCAWIFAKPTQLILCQMLPRELWCLHRCGRSAKPSCVGIGIVIHRRERIGYCPCPRHLRQNRVFSSKTRISGWVRALGCQLLEHEIGAKTV